MPSFDARSVANLLLDIADEGARPLTNLMLQKVVYFVHGRYLLAKNEPLVHGTFEAWQFGPVHPHVYGAFKIYGDKTITGRAKRVDPVSLKEVPLVVVQDEEVTRIAKSAMAELLKWSPSDLVTISHAKGGPWDFVVERARRRMSISVRISNDVIRERFKFHKIDVAEMREKEVPNENSPFS